MSSIATRRSDCRFCGGRDLNLVFQLEPTPVGADYISAGRLGEIQESHPLDLFSCKECGYVGLTEVIDPGHFLDETIDEASVSAGVIEHLQEYTKDILEFVGSPKGSFFIDIGLHDHAFLDLFQNQGMRVLGINHSRFASKKAPTSRVPTFCGFLTAESARSIRAEHGPAHVITANRVFANIDQIGDMFEGVKELLSPDGIFVFETGYLVDIVQKCLFDTIHHEHLGYDLVRPMKSLFPRYGMELVDIERVLIKGGSLRAWVQHAGGSRTVGPAVAEMIADEEAQGFDTPAPYQALKATLESTKSELHELFDGLIADGQTIAGYGASIGSTTQIHQFDLGEILTFLVDDDPRNQYLFSPGHHIPVFPSQAIYDKSADYVVILAWRYAEQIINRHPSFLDQGGHFIVPLPELRII